MCLSPRILVNQQRKDIITVYNYVAPLTPLLLYLFSFYYRGNLLLLQTEGISLFNESAGEYVAGMLMYTAIDSLVNAPCGQRGDKEDLNIICSLILAFYLLPPFHNMKV